MFWVDTDFYPYIILFNSNHYYWKLNAILIEIVEIRFKVKSLNPLDTHLFIIYTYYTQTDRLNLSLAHLLFKCRLHLRAFV